MSRWSQNRLVWVCTICWRLMAISGPLQTRQIKQLRKHGNDSKQMKAIQQTCFSADEIWLVRQSFAFSTFGRDSFAINNDRGLPSVQSRDYCPGRTWISMAIHIPMMCSCCSFVLHDCGHIWSFENSSSIKQMLWPSDHLTCNLFETGFIKQSRLIQ